uniref:Uncharacterized protein n=1 Tax=Aureoumbra lagunensis TaxID=44058 RepID=A0A7S3JTM9_9STRA
MRLVLCALLICVYGRQQDYSARLRALGYHRNEIVEIKASVARVVVRRGLPRPQGGMPESWKEDKFQKKNREPWNPLSIFKPLGKIVRTCGSFALSTLKIAVPISIVIAFAGGLWPVVSILITQIRSATNGTIERLHSSPKSQPVMIMPRRIPQRPLKQQPKLPQTSTTQSKPEQPPPEEQRPIESPQRRISESPQDQFVLDGPDDPSLRRGAYSPL